MRDRPAWNHNVAYHHEVLAALPPGGGDVLDVGCGTGALVASLAERCRHVTGIDVDAAALASAERRLAGTGNVTLLRGDVLTAALPSASYDLVAAVASLHHLPLRPGLARLGDLVRPGGCLVVVGLSRTVSATDHLAAAAALPVAKTLRLRRGHDPVDAPIADPRESLSEIRAAAGEILPGARIRRRLLFRYVLRWRRPA